MSKRFDDEYLMKRANAIRNILEGETASAEEAATIAWLALAGIALDAARSNGEIASSLILAEAAVLADDLATGRLHLSRPH